MSKGSQVQIKKMAIEKFKGKSADYWEDVIWYFFRKKVGVSSGG